MPRYDAWERPLRRNARVRGDSGADTVTAALTAQVIICVILLICAIGMKKLDIVKYTGLKAQYASMIKDREQTDKAVEWIIDPEGLFGGLSGALGRYVKSILPNSDEQARHPEEKQIENSQISPEETAPESEPAFDYLSSRNIAYMSVGNGQLPSGGETGNAMLPPPSGSTLAPVYAGVKLKPPVTGVITSDFAYRYHPLTGKEDFHTGMDIASKEGAAIAAALPGKVEEVGWSEFYGNYIVLRHAENLKTSYSHCSRIIASEGMAVRQGERIALVGETGAATGPHLHFSVIVDGEFTDPAWVLKEYIRPAQ